MTTGRFVSGRRQTPVSDARAAGEGFVHTKTFEILSRAGFVARALVWGIIGLLAFKLAVGWGGTITNQQGALHTVAKQPGGHFLLTLVAIGLGGYALWRFARAALGHGPEGADSGFERLAAAASGVGYAILCALAVDILLGGDGSSTTPKSATAGVLGWPAGTWIVGIAGALMIGAGCYYAYRGITQRFLRDSKVEEMGPRIRAWITLIGTIGLAARAVVFVLVGVFLIKAAVDYNPQKAVGLDGALAKLVDANYGPWLLGLVAAGLISFALYSLSDARYRRI